MEKVYKKIQDEIGEFRGTRIPHNPDYAQSSHEIIELIDLYWSDKFRDHQEDSLNYKKCFYNIIEAPTLTAAKQTDIDTKDIKVIAEDGQSFYPAWFFRKELILWMKEKGFAKLLNKVVYNCPKYGAVVVKRVKDDIHFVPLQNLYSEPDVETLKDSVYVIEVHDYTASKLKGMPWNKEKIDEAIDKFADDGHILVYERYGEMEGTDNNYFIVAGKRDDNVGGKRSSQSEVFSEIILFEDKVDDLPYKEVHWDKINGRWLGKGIVEKLFEAQIHTNRIANYKSHGLHWTSKHIYQTRDAGVPSNILTDVEDGDVIISNDDVNPIPVEERNLPAYREEEERWDRLVDRRSFAFDVMRGERAPSGTPLGSSILQTKMAGGFFELKREDIGQFIKDIIFDWIIPGFKKNRKKLHFIMKSEFDDDELSKINELIVNGRLNKRLIKYVKERGRIPNKGEMDIMRKIVGEKVSKTKSIEIPADYYDNLKYKIKVDITGEEIDLASRVTTLQTILQIIGSNPTILQDRNTRKVFFSLLEMAGISPTNFELGEEKPNEEIQQAKVGGSIARIQPQTMPSTANISTTL